MHLRRLARLITVAVVTAVILTGCSSNSIFGAPMDVKDSAGLTREDVAQLTLEEEFNLFATRYNHMEAILADAQHAISDDTWLWNGGDTLPTSGYAGGVDGTLPGSDGTNSYYLTTARIIKPEGAHGALSDLNPMIDYFTDHGWQVRVRNETNWDDVTGITGDGWQFVYSIQESGQYSLSVYSELLWTNDSHELLLAIGSRDAANFPDESIPGVFLPFPKWEDPAIY